MVRQALLITSNSRGSDGE